jgi:hypothetical protein
VSRLRIHVHVGGRVKGLRARREEEVRKICVLHWSEGPWLVRRCEGAKDGVRALAGDTQRAERPECNFDIEKTVESANDLGGLEQCQEEDTKS